MAARRLSRRVMVTRALLAPVMSALVVALPGAQAPRTTPPAAAREARTGDQPVKLVVLVAVDQFRADYLTRFGAPRAGLRTLMTRGAVFTNAYLEHGHTVTAVGHSTMLTGATPSVSGIIANAWYERSTKSNVESVTDATVRIVGGEGSAPGVSPRRLLVTTLGDQLKLASPAAPGTPEAPRVIGISIKDRSAILPSGHAADAAYFVRNGKFVTSSYYRDALPAWVEAVNAKDLIGSQAGKRWEFEGGVHEYPAQAGSSLTSDVLTGPVGNELVLAMAAAALEHERLGQRGVTDVLTVSFSANDSVGHKYGPESPEVRDMTAQVDRQIQRLFDEIEKRVGLAHVLVALTADHGALPLPEAITALRIPGGRFKSQPVQEAVEAALDARFGQATWIDNMSLPQIYLNHALLAEKKIEPVLARRVAAEAAATVPHVARVYTRDAIINGQMEGDHIAELVVRAYHRERSGDLYVVLEPNWTTAATGTSHGTVYGYDAHIPLIIMGPGVKPGTYARNVALNDLAPTLATVLGIEPPNGAQGHAIADAIRGGARAALPLPAKKPAAHAGTP